MILSQRIAQMLEEMLEEGGGELSIVRNDFASQMGCVPSQINYVITSRFTPERGYQVESRRGGGGYIRIRKVAMEKNAYLMHFYQAIRSTMDYETARYFLSQLVYEKVMTSREAKLLLSTLTESALSPIRPEGRGMVRANLMKHILLQLITEQEERK